MPAPSGMRKQIKEKQDAISNYLSSLEPYGTRLMYGSIIFGGLAGLFNVVVLMPSQAPADHWVHWLLPLLAAVSSFLAMVAAGLYKFNVESRLSLLQKCSARLEGLAALLDVNQLTETEASKQYQRYVEECPPIPRYRKLSFEAVRGTISEPREGQAVAAGFNASGEAHNLGAGITLWLTVEIDDRIWPKEGAVDVDIHGQWNQPVFEDGVGDQIGLSLWAANAKANRTLRAWLDVGNRTRTFTELRPLPGMKRLARVRGIRRVTDRILPP